MASKEEREAEYAKAVSSAKMVLAFLDGSNKGRELAVVASALQHADNAAEAIRKLRAMNMENQ